MHSCTTIKIKAISRFLSLQMIAPRACVFETSEKNFIAPLLVNKVNQIHSVHSLFVLTKSVDFLREIVVKSQKYCMHAFSRKNPEAEDVLRNINRTEAAEGLKCRFLSLMTLTFDL